MADNSSRRGGVLTLNIDGTDYDVVEGVTYILSKTKRETLSGISGVQGFKETPIAGQIKAKLRDDGGFKAADFATKTASQVIVNAANGKTVAGTNMWLVETIEVDPIEGTFEVTFEGVSVREV
jgi:hypothetical protein